MRKRLLISMAVLSLALPALAATGRAPSVPLHIDATKGVDRGVDYTKLTLIGPWDDRNYALTRKDLALLAPNEIAQRDPIPAFFRVEMRRANPGLRRTGEGQYPRSALEVFYLLHTGYQIDGKFYNRATIRNGAFVVLPNRPGGVEEDDPLRALAGDVRVTSPTGGAESTIKINPLDANKVIAGSNGPGSGQFMHFSTNGGTSWTQAPALPLGGTCCDPTIDYSADGTKAYTGTLGGCGASACDVWIYRSADGGATWTDLQNVTPGDPRRELTSGAISDKEFIHVDKFATSPRKDNIYVTWHDNNILKFSRSTDFGNTFSAPVSMSSGTAQDGIGSDITSDKSGNVYYFWPTVTGKTTLVRKSTDGGATFAAAVTVATNMDGYDFNIPAMETRRAFQYVSADTDVTNGAFANRIYVAWTDTTAAESTTAANNHGRIRVAFSSDGGATWSVRTPHETADASTVDRFHQWLGVGSDGTVHVMFYDTRQNAARTSVDIYYSKSTDGGNTWSAPVRATSSTSPHIEDSFQWGDYNGLDVLGSQVLGIFTDNRNESLGSADSIDVYAASAPGGACVPPAVPTGVSATTISTSQINVAWTAS
ncbi:MAG: sialidase family protein, partial [Acidobacteriota bacterium]